MKRVVVSLLVIVIIAVAGVGGWYLWDSLQKEKNKTGELENKLANLETTGSNEKTENTILTGENNKKEEKNEITKDEALKIAKEVYHNAYQKFADGSGMGNSVSKGKVNPNIKNDDRLKFEVSLNEELKKYFSNDGIERIKAVCDIYKENEKDMFVQSEQQLDPFGNMMSTIFGQTDQGERKLVIVSYSNDCIVAKSNEYENYEGLQNEYSRYVIFVKEGEKWLIDNFN